MPTDNYMQIKGIEGTATDDQHKNWIEVQSYSWGVSQSASVAQSTAGRASLQDLSLVKEMDGSSAKIAEECAKGTHFDEVKLDVCRATGEGKQTTFMQYTLQDVVISSYSVNGGGGGYPMENVSLNYGKIKWEFTKVDAKGKAAGKVAAGWDAKANKPM